MAGKHQIRGQDCDCRYLHQPHSSSHHLTHPGNHDITLDEAFYADHGLHFHNQNPQFPTDCISLITSSPSITYLNHSSATIRLSSPSGPHTHFTVFGSPCSPRIGLWAFSYDSPQSPTPSSGLTNLWDAIPLSTDIVVTHTPPRTHRDETPDRRSIGCEALRCALWRVRPRLAVCGHVHTSRGAERTAWDLTSRDVVFAEAGITAWTDPAEGSSSKMSLVDLTGRKAPPLANDGSHPTPSSNSDTEVCIGLGGDPSSGPCDVEALRGRTGRRETCVVNAAIVQTSYPHVNGKKLTRPIVVDLDLPVWEE